jgi:hypothetical protein
MLFAKFSVDFSSFITCTRRMGQPILAIHASIQADRPQEVPFWGLMKKNFCLGDYLLPKNFTRHFRSKFESQWKLLNGEIV